jgi:hypothetical protein
MAVGSNKIVREKEKKKLERDDHKFELRNIDVILFEFSIQSIFAVEELCGCRANGVHDASWCSRLVLAVGFSLKGDEILRVCLKLLVQDDLSEQHGARWVIRLAFNEQRIVRDVTLRILLRLAKLFVGVCFDAHKLGVPDECTIDKEGAGWCVDHSIADRILGLTLSE